MKFRNPFRFKHMISIPKASTTLDDSVLDWLEENVGQDPDHWTLRDYKGCFVFYFTNDNDAVMFKLTWGGK